MTFFDKWVTKKNAVLISIVGICISVLMFWLESNYPALCEHYNTYGFVFRYCDDFLLALFPFYVAIFISVAFFWLSNETFLPWVRFSFWWILLLAFFIFVAPTDEGGVISTPSVQDVLFILNPILYLVISIFVIWWKRKK